MATNNSRKYISLAKLETFLDKCMKFFAPAKHTHKAADIEGVPTVDTTLNTQSTNAIQNKVVAEKINELDNKITYKIQLHTWEEND